MTGRVLSGIVHVIRSGGRWVDAPTAYGPKKTLYNRYMRWAERGVWEGIFSAIAGADGAPDRLMIDSTIVKAHRSSGGGKGGLWLMVSADPKAGGRPRSTS